MSLLDSSVFGSTLRVLVLFLKSSVLISKIGKQPPLLSNKKQKVKGL
jgi:hypothetical protein